jgi:hypothetical protein
VVAVSLAFKADIATAHVAVAQFALDEGSYPRVRTSLAAAEAVSPVGKTDAMRDVWIGYAEHMTAARGIFIKGADVEDVRDALAEAEAFAPERVAAVNASLSRTFYLLRVVIPGTFLTLIIAAVLFARARAAAAKRRFAEEAE